MGAFYIIELQFRVLAATEKQSRIIVVNSLFTIIEPLFGHS
jgi:hypothetical protein